MSTNEALEIVLDLAKQNAADENCDIPKAEIDRQWLAISIVEALQQTRERNEKGLDT